MLELCEIFLLDEQSSDRSKATLDAESGPNHRRQYKREHVEQIKVSRIKVIEKIKTTR